ncbi:hypothetical protein [Zavarzinia compransoris]|uniref:Glycosyltransferase RgtA/B/C/D-like domain-containing protein n=1 Tax=Zavarzinia compransoris TaxID=1264899 RepID=A0A317E2I5_9PROT|nr:hypothetical protein [Zavarzinia compransoris]PWR20811.1 hypothetical protein DKG75_12530 [Zavarzinia compransoris]TDP44353.1 hypothetical protein DES42_107118 [Zavarzinia compransoris]
MARRESIGNASGAVAFGLALCLGLRLLSPVLVPYADDGFFSQWAVEYARSGQLRSPFLDTLFPDFKDLLLVYPPLHVVLAGLWLRLDGISRAGFDNYLYLSMALATIGFALVLTRVFASRAAAYMAFPIVAAVYLLYPFRPEVTGFTLLALGLGIGWGLGGGRRLAALGLIMLAPLTAPSVFGVALVLVLAQELALAREARWRGLPAQALGLGLAAVFALFVFLLSIQFQLGEFIRQFLLHAGLGQQSFNLQSLLSGLGVAALGLWLWRLRTGRRDALLLAAIGLGLCVSELFHVRGFVRDLVLALAVTGFAAVILRHTTLAGPVAIVIAGGFCLGYLGNLASMNLFGTAIERPERAQQLADWRAAAAAGRLRLFVDDVGLRDLLDFDSRDIGSWNRHDPIPGGIPTGFDVLGPDEIWLVSGYTLFGYLRGEAFAPAGALGGYERAPSLGCYAGRVGCRLPLRHHDYLMFRRGADGQVVTEVF